MRRTSTAQHTVSPPDRSPQGIVFLININFSLFFLFLFLREYVYQLPVTVSAALPCPPGIGVMILRQLIIRPPKTEQKCKMSQIQARID